GQFERHARRVEHHEIVASPLHLGEAQAHGAVVASAVGSGRLHIVAWYAPSRNLQYNEGSRLGRVLKRLCTHRYCSGSWRTSCSIHWFMRSVSASASSLG